MEMIRHDDVWTDEPCGRVIPDIAEEGVGRIAGEPGFTVGGADGDKDQGFLVLTDMNARSRTSAEDGPTRWHDERMGRSVGSGDCFLIGLRVMEDIRYLADRTL
jgi:hypothetical protein